ncbi:MAG: substrate-binding domain-containing protein [Candidatus Bathyarchaeota archaeon]
MNKHIAIVVAVIIIVAAVAGTAAYITINQEKEKLVVSTTTSLYETGFLDILDSKFEAQYPSVNVTFISQGTGLAIQTAMRGDADMILVHDTAREKTFLDDGYGVNRKIIAYNYFVIVGPEEDPAGVRGLGPVDALLKIKSAGEDGLAEWVSRGDDSGTHSKEKSLWTAGGEDASILRNQAWYIEAGSGMTATLKLTDEKRAYTMCDMGSYLNNYVRGNIDLDIVVDAGKETLNVYSAIACDPRNPDLAHVKFNRAMSFIKFLASDEIQDLFAEFGVDTFGQPLFNPAVEILETNSDPATASWIRQLAFFDGTECPADKQYNPSGLTFVSTISTMPKRVIP